MQILGGVDPGVSVPQNAPTSLSAIPVNTSVAISFTAPTNDGGSPITNYEYSFDNSSWTALSPADATSPVTVSGLTQNTAYTVYLRAVNIVGVGPGSTGVSFTTEGVPTGTATITSVSVGTTTATVNFAVAAGGGAITGYDLYVANYTNAWNNTTASPISVTGLTSNTTYTFYVRAKNAYGVGPQSAGVNATTNKAAPVGVHFLVVAGGGGPGGQNNVGVSGGGGGGGFRTSYGTSGRSSAAEGTLNLTNTSYTVSIGAGGGLNASGGNSQFASITSTGGGKGGTDPTTSGVGGGSGGGAGCTGTGTFPGGAGIAGQGGDGFQATSQTSQFNRAGCGGGASGNAGADVGGAGLTSTISGSTQGYAGGGRGGRLGTTGSTNGTYSGTSYYGGGGSGVTGESLGAQGVVIIRYSTSYDLPTVSGLTYSAAVSGSERILTFTAGTGTVSW